MDALHTIRDTTCSIVDTHRADRLMTVKANARETSGMLGTIDWERDGMGAVGAKSSLPKSARVKFPG